jgi:hypothetical protein
MLENTVRAIKKGINPALMKLLLHSAMVQKVFQLIIDINLKY